jgi:hypothetical protein
VSLGWCTQPPALSEISQTLGRARSGAMDTGHAQARARGHTDMNSKQPQTHKKNAPGGGGASSEPLGAALCRS